VGKLINIDNGGTLTDVCVLDGDAVHRTKTLTTPYDLSKCFFEGLRKVSAEIYGREDVVSLLSSTEHIRYSTTQGTNALVERKGPRLGLLLTGSLRVEALRSTPGAGELFETIVGERVARLDLAAEVEELERAAVQAVNRLASAGANRVVVAHGGDGRFAAEDRLKRIFLEKFPQHLLGAIPILYSHEIVEDDDDVRRAWTALVNAFLHPAMERFLYNAEHKLRAAKSQSPLLIFRNDGHSARVSKTIALKTYSSGPRGGMEGARALARHHRIEHLVSIDVGGTTTDVGEVRAGEVHEERRGKLEGVEISFPLCHLVSTGVGGSSLLRVEGGVIRVGPESVGSAPGPACFGLGGTEATITDAFVVAGLLDPDSFFGGELRLDAARARSAVAERIAKPLGVSPETAAARMEEAWVAKIADAVRTFTTIGAETTIAAFGGAGPLVVCRVAEALGVSRVLIPGLAAVFSAFGLGFSDIAHEYEAPVESAADVTRARELLTTRARRGMFAEGFALEDCRVEARLRIAGRDRDEVVDLPDRLPERRADEHFFLSLAVSKPIAEPRLKGTFAATPLPAVSRSTRRILAGAETVELPLYRVEDQPAGAGAEGPAVLEEPFFTCRIDPGWRFDVNDGGDVRLARTAAPRGGRT
jgi:N-methylhydantoinase A